MDDRYGIWSPTTATRDASTVTHDARRPRAGDGIPLPRRRALAERHDRRGARVVPDRPLARLDGSDGNCLRGRCHRHGGERLALRPPTGAAARRHADTAGDPARVEPAPAGDADWSRAPRRSASTATRSSRAWSGASARRTTRRRSAPASTSSSVSRCSNPDEQFDRLAGRAMSTVDASTPGVSGPGPGRLAPGGRSRHVRRRREQAPAAEGRRPRHVPHPHRPLLAARSTADEGQGDLSRLLRQRGRDRLRHVPGRGPLLARADRQRLLDAAGARRAHPRQADLPVDRSGSDGALPREPGSDPRRRPRRDLARDRGRRPRHRLLPRLVGRGHPQRGAPRRTARSSRSPPRSSPPSPRRTGRPRAPSASAHAATTARPTSSQ